MWKRIVRPLASRKVRVALATVVAAYAAEFGLAVKGDVIYTILGVGVALILGIAHEDAGRGAVSPTHSSEARSVLPTGDR